VYAPPPYGEHAASAASAAPAQGDQDIGPIVTRSRRDLGKTARDRPQALAIIIGIPPHIIMHGMPCCIMDVIMPMRSFIISI